MAKRKQSTAELIGISNFSRNGLQTKSQGEIVYFLVQPTNISVLSEQSVAIKIQHLMQLLSVQPDIEIICSDARENFEYNKLSLARRAEKETNLKVQLLLRKDMKFLDDIQLQMSTARGIHVRLPCEKRKRSVLCNFESARKADQRSGLRLPQSNQGRYQAYPLEVLRSHDRGCYR